MPGVRHVSVSATNHAAKHVNQWPLSFLYLKPNNLDPDKRMLRKRKVFLAGVNFETYPIAQRTVTVKFAS
jgi:hypothetical protein